MTRWRKSSRSSGDAGGEACVEVDFSGPSAALRDSKNPEETIKLSGRGFHAFVGLACRYGDPAR